MVQADKQRVKQLMTEHNKEIKQLAEEFESCQKESGLHIQLVTNEPKAFDSFMAHYGNSAA